MAVHPPTRPRPLIRTLLPLSLVFLAVGLSTALVLPFLSLFLRTAVHAGPSLVTVFLVATPLAGVVASTLLARLSDRRPVRRNLLVAAALAGLASASVTAFVRNYWVLLAVTVTAAAVANSLFPQSFAYARQVLQRDSPERTAMGINAFRTLFSLAWVAGPAVAAVLLDTGGFRLVYGTAAVMYAVAALVAAGLLTEVGTVSSGGGPAAVDVPPPERPGAVPAPDDAAGVPASDGAAGAPALAGAAGVPPLVGAAGVPASDRAGGVPPSDRAGGVPPRWVLVATVAAFTMLQCPLTLGMQALPLFISTDLGAPAADAGLILGLCAALEIPLMVALGLLTSRIPLRRLVLAGAGCGIGYYVLATAAPSLGVLAAGQVVNAVFIAAVSGLGISYLQELLPHHPGRATTLFTNSFPIGAILAGPLLGLAAHVGYRLAYGLSAGLCAAGLIVLLAAGRARVTVPEAGGPDSVDRGRPVPSAPI
ncbi:MFS transporter [Plantactinospora sp. KBS50]|uniref:MFS transporter n=1 Tax=Plantactinospora sp. KBS50 TaxID=2024580 RepID=UPI000BAABF03|nr:MFS transporter [Plantactinospora sp. KBS50]ASW55326.1 hypothetical protein CIK06_15830 [Plantactinospora sp. KBS50]